MKILNFFQFLWVIFALLVPDPDPATQINADPYGPGPDVNPDPQPWIKAISCAVRVHTHEPFLTRDFILEVVVQHF
jgi:hypothetical protein